MDEGELVAAAGQYVMQAAELIRQAGEAIDPVARRRLQVKAASALRTAADKLDDYGYLTE